MKNLECVSVAGVNGTPSQFIFCSAKYTVAVRRQGLEREADFDRTSGGARVMGEARSCWKPILVDVRLLYRSSIVAMVDISTIGLLVIVFGWCRSYVLVNNRVYKIRLQ